MSSEATPRATLFTFEGSLWGSVPRIGLIEKGYAPEDLETRSVNLLHGENFSPSFLRVNSAATVPTLVVPLAETTGSEVDTKFRAIVDSVDVLDFLDKSRSQNILDAKGQSDAAPAPVLAPATIEGKAKSDAIIKLVHSEAADGNFLLLSARTEAELDAQRGALPAAFVKGRDDALKRFLTETKNSAGQAQNPRDNATNDRLIKWYEDKIASQAPLVAAYLSNDAAAKSGFVAVSRAAWSKLPSVLATLSASIEGPYALGDQLSLADVHTMAWLARLFAVAHAKEPEVKDDVEALNRTLQHECVGTQAVVDDKLAAYWALLKERPSFQAVYKDGLH